MNSTNEKSLEKSHLGDLAQSSSGKSGSDDEFAVTWTEKDEKRVRNKLDWQIVSLSCEKVVLYHLLMDYSGANGYSTIPDVLFRPVRPSYAHTATG